MSSELDKCLEEESSTMDQNLLRVAVMGMPGVGKKTFVSALKNEWNELRSKKPWKKENTNDLGIKGRDLALDVIETTSKRKLSFGIRLPSCDAFILLYSLVCDESFKSVCDVREKIIQQKGYSIPVIFVANKTDIADEVDKVERAYRDLNTSCEWEHGHYEISARKNSDVNRVLEQMMKRVNQDTPGGEGEGASAGSTLDKCKSFFSSMLK